MTLSVVSQKKGENRQTSRYKDEREKERRVREYVNDRPETEELVTCPFPPPTERRADPCHHPTAQIYY